MVIFMLLIIWICCRLFLWYIVRSRLEVILLINSHIHLFYQHTVSWNSISGWQINDVTDYQSTNVNTFNSSKLTSVNSHPLFIYFFFQKQKLFLFQVVTNSGNETSKEQTGEDGKWLDKARFVRTEICKDKIYGSSPD